MKRRHFLTAITLALGILLAPVLSSTAQAGEHETLSPAVQEWEATGNYMTVDGHRVFYHDVGEGPVILLLHGHPGSSYDWRAIVDILKPKARLISFDHVGWGLSDKPRAFSYSLFQAADIAEGVLAELGVTEAHVVSHDISTSVHNELMARQLEGSLSFNMLTAMLTNGSMLQWISSEPDEQNLAAHNETLFEAMRQFAQITPEYMKQTLNGMTIGNLNDDHLTMMTELFLRDDGQNLLAAQSNYMRERYIHADRWIGAIEQFEPLRIVWGSDDPVANVGIGRELAERAQQASYLEIKGLGHFPNAEGPEKIAEQILIATGLN